MPEQAHAHDGLPSAIAGRRSLILAATMMATFMVAVESTIVATAMPTIVADLGDFHLFSWVFAAYLLMQVVSVPIYGRLADLYGRKPVFFVGASLFLFGSTLCGFARSMPMLIAFRTLQGLGAGAVQPIAYTIVGDIYEPAERARVQGFLSGVFGIAAIIGPSLGAFLVEHASWAIVFWVNLPIGATAITMLAVFLREQPQTRLHQIDWLGSMLLMLGGGVLMIALIQAESLSRWMLALCVVVGTAALGALAQHERRVAEPMLPLELCSNRVVVLCSLGSFTIGGIMMGVSGFLPTYVQGVMGRSATAAGIVLGAMSVSWAVASVVAGRVMVRTTYRRTAIFGGVALVLGSAVLVAMTPARGPAWAEVGALMVGVGMGFCNTSYLVSAQAAVSWQQRGATTSAYLFMRLVGQSISVALFGAVLNSGVLRHVSESRGVVDRLMEPALRRGLGGAEIAQLTAAMAAALENVYVICALLGVATLALGAGLPAQFSPARSPGGD